MKPLKNKKILVTGGTGQIAGPIVEDFARQNEVWCGARFSNPDRKAELEAMGVKTCHYDMANPDLSSVPDDFTHVVHSGLVSSTNLTEHDLGVSINAEGTGLLMRHCRNAEAFLHVSSCSVYARSAQHPHRPYAEDDDLGTNSASYSSIYPVIKLTSEGAARAACRILELPTVIARMNVGYSWTGHGGLPVRFYNMMREGRPIAVPHGYPNISSPIAGEDIARQAHLLLQVATIPATIVNWAGDDPVPDREMCEWIGKLTGLVPQFVESDITMDCQWCDNTRREALIGRCEMDWKNGIRQTFQRLGIIGS